VAASGLARRLLHWQPRHDDLEFILRTAWEWELKLAGRLKIDQNEIEGDAL